MPSANARRARDARKSSGRSDHADHADRADRADFADLGARRTPSDSRVETAQLVLPGLTNTHGTIFGGFLMQWIDMAASIAAARHSGGPVVTASMDRLHFLSPVQLGEVVLLQAQVNFVARRQTTRAYLTFVAVDEHGRPRPVPSLHPETAEERRREGDARRRRAVRLRERRAMKKV
jgi:acyl-CoA hydrolase